MNNNLNKMIQFKVIESYIAYNRKNYSLITFQYKLCKIETKFMLC